MVQEGSVFGVPILVGDQQFEVIADTGSSDLWLAGANFKCLSFNTAKPVPQSECNFGPLYNISGTFTKIPNQNFNVSYGSGEKITGIVGNEHITFGGISVTQEFGVAETAAWQLNDTSISGLLGMAFPAGTTAFKGDNPENDDVKNLTNHAVYNPLFTTMYAEGKVAPLFSMAIGRGTSGGVLAIGGLPEGYSDTNFTSTPLLKSTLNSAGKASQQFRFYNISVDGVSFSGTQNTSPFFAIVDSGTNLNFVPDGVADALNGFFIPPATLDETSQLYLVDCNATAPDVGVVINGATFDINYVDMIVPNGDGTCASGMQRSASNLSVLGDVFMKNVLAVFDIGESKMRFTSR
jgi:hypothetical protein